MIQHLHTTVAHLQQQRSDRLIQALSSFNSGKSSLREWWLDVEVNRMLNAGRLADISDDMIDPALLATNADVKSSDRRDSPAKSQSEMPLKAQGMKIVWIFLCVTILLIRYHPD